MMVLPVAFIPLIANFPTGLVLYWMTTNLWTVGQGLVTRQLAPKPVPPPKRTSKTAPKERGEDGGDGDGAQASRPAPKPTGQPRVVRRKKKRARR
jgi:YidC/Oxa1 family membrane protein insertase